MPADFERRYDTRRAAAWLSERLGLTIRPKTLTNLRALGKGPQGWQYYGQRPTITESALRAYADQALRPEPTRRQTRLPGNYRTTRQR
jgi:hypothetical protein